MSSLKKPGAGRWSAKRKVSVVLELLRGADLESTSRKHRVTVATLSLFDGMDADAIGGAMIDGGEDGHCAVVGPRRWK